MHESTAGTHNLTAAQFRANSAYVLIQFNIPRRGNQNGAGDDRAPFCTKSLTEHRYTQEVTQNTYIHTPDNIYKDFIRDAHN